MLLILKTKDLSHKLDLKFLNETTNKCLQEAEKANQYY